MRLHLITAAVVAISGPALASSIQPVVSGSSNNGSIVVKSCGDCPAAGAKASPTDYVVPTLEPGTQTTEVREINGERKTVRTEAWLGGSPVVFVTKAPAETAAATGSAGDGIDTQAKTAAVDTAPATLDLDSFTLRN